MDVRFSRWGGEECQKLYQKGGLGNTWNSSGSSFSLCLGAFEWLSERALLRRCRFVASVSESPA